MARLLRSGVMAVYVLSGTVALYAAQSGDMFSDQGYTVENRPSVPSDQYYGYRSHPDVFPNQAPHMRTDKDMFDSVPTPSDPGVEQHFSSHLDTPAPDGALFLDPNGSR